MSEKKRVVKNSLLYAVSTLLTKAVNFFLLPVLTVYLTPEDYGIVSLVQSFSNVASFIVAFSLFSAVLRFYVDYKDDPIELKSFYGTVILFIFISGTVFNIVVFFSSSLLVKYLFEGVAYYPYILVGMMSLVFYSLRTVHQRILESMQQGQKLITVNLVGFAGKICLTLLFLIVGRLGAISVLLAVLIVNFLVSVYMVFDLWTNDLLSFSFDIKKLKHALKYSIPIIPHNISTSIASFFSRFFINRSSSLTAVGLYSVGAQFGGLIDLVQNAGNRAFAPWFFTRMKGSEGEEQLDTVSFSHLLLYVYSIAYLGIGLFSQEAIMLMTAPSYRLAWTVIPILVVAFAVKSIYYFYVNILFYHKEASKKIFLASISGSFLDIFLAQALIPPFGMYGAAVAFMMAKILVVMIVVFISKPYNDIGYRVLPMVRIIVPSFIFLAVGLYFSYDRYQETLSFMNFLYKFGVFLLYVAIVAFKNRAVLSRLRRKNG